MTQEFRLSVTPIGDDEYLVRTERVAPGVPLAEEQVRWPVEEWLALTRQLMNDPLLGLLDGTAPLGQGARIPSYLATGASLSTPATLIALGQHLYSGLFQGNLRDSWTCAQGIAQHRREVLQLRLGLKGRRLPPLPWEVLHAGDRPLAAGTDVVFSRYQPGTSLHKQTKIATPGLPLKILMAIAAPSDRDSLQLKREVLHLQQELHHTSTLNPQLQAPEIQLTILEQPDREQLTQALEQGHYQVLHYAGHSNLGARGGELYLVSGRTGLTETLSGEDLAGLLVNNGIQMAVFNSCRGAYGEASEATGDTGERNLAEALVKRGIPAVLAMAERIPDDVALTLTRLFYRNLNQGYPVDLSLSRARAGLISAYGSHQLYWALPILYLHPDFDGYLSATQTELWGVGVQETAGEVAALPPGLPKTSEYPPRRGGELSSLNLSSPLGNYEVPIYMADELDNSAAENLEDFVDIECEDEWAGKAEDAALIAELMRQLANPDSPTGERNSQLLNEQVKPMAPVPISATTTPAVSQETAKKASSKQPPLEKGKQRKKPWALAAAPMVVAIGVLGVWLTASQGPKPGELLAPNPISLEGRPTVQPVKLEATNTAQVTALAMEYFHQGNFAAGKEATEELLDRVALPQAKAALEQVPASNNDPEINFLRGRLAWQFLQVGNQNYSVDDVRRYWELALKMRSDSLSYHNALGFAYYLEGQLEPAQQVWLGGLDWAEATSKTEPQQVASGNPRLSVSMVREEVLTAYAGLALVRVQQAKRVSPTQRVKLLNEAIKLRQRVMGEEPLNFQPDALGKNWMWPEAAIRDWQVLLKKVD